MTRDNDQVIAFGHIMARSEAKRLQGMDPELVGALQRAEEAEGREEQFRNWWTGVSKQLDDLKRENAQKDWEHATSCKDHGKQLRDLDADMLRLNRMHKRAEKERVDLVVGLHVLQDIIRAHRAGRTRESLTVDELVAAFEGIVWRTLGETPETEKRPVKAIQLSLLGEAS